jgi:hypothetical protein
MSRLVEGLILLLATASISGFMVPFIVNRVQVRNQQRLKTFEADLARQLKIIEEQGALVQRLSVTLWECLSLLIDPIHYGQSTLRNLELAAKTDLESKSPEHQSRPTMYDQAVSQYLDNCTRLLGSIRADIGSAVRLVPEDQIRILKRLWYEELLPLDLIVTRLILVGPTPSNSKEWAKTHSRILEDLAKKLDTTIDGLAAALGLKYDAAIAAARGGGGRRSRHNRLITDDGVAAVSASLAG